MNQAIQQQKQYNDAYAKEQEKQFATVIQNPISKQNEWTMDELKELVGGDFNKVTVISKSPNKSLQLETHLKENGYLHKADYWIYRNVFLDSKTGDPINLRFDILKIQQNATAGANETGNDLDALPEIEKTRLSFIDKNQVALWYDNAQLTMKVSFLDANDDPVVLEKPLVIITDVDDNQAVKMDEMNVKWLKGKNLVDRNGIVGNFGTYRDTTPDNRSAWMMYALPATDHFTYTFYSFSSSFGGVYQGVGSETISYTRPNKQMVQWEGQDIQLTELFVLQPSTPSKPNVIVSQPTQAHITTTSTNVVPASTSVETSSTVSTGVSLSWMSSLFGCILSGLGLISIKKRS